MEATRLRIIVGRQAGNALAAVGIGLAMAAAGAAETPILRHLNVIAFEAVAEVPVVVEGACVAPNPRYQDSLRCRLIAADGRELGAAAAVPGQSLRLSVPALPAGRAALEVSSGWSTGALRLPEEVPWALSARPEQPLRTIRPWGPLYLFVPADAASFTLWIQADVTREAARLLVCAPDGTVVVEREDDFDLRTAITVPVSPEQAGRAWSVELRPCATPGWYVDDVSFELGPEVPGFLSPRADWAVRFGLGWQGPATGPRSTRLAAAPASRPPYRPPPPERLAAAYDRRGGPAWRTTLPFTYVLDYGQNHVGNPDYIPMVAGAPPALLHLGKDVPLNHGWGPVKALGGENQAHGSGDSIERLEPAAVAERLTALRDLVSGLHGAGVRWVTPYICSMTLNGDPEKRSGFWEFYDHWNDYLELGLAPRPPQDPKEWLQTTADGRPRLYYAYDIAAGHYPPFATNHRFAACWHAEGWRTWLLEVVRFVARTGCDGVFVDNGCSQRSFSPAALAAFRRFLRARFTPAQAAELLGVDDLDRVTFADERETTPLACEQRRFWCSTLRDQVDAIRQAGERTLGREFLVFPNGGHPAELQEGLRDADFVMFEKSIGTYGTNPGLVLHPVLEGVTARIVNDNLFELLFVRSLRERVRPVILSRPGYPRAMRHLVLNADAARLGLAECAAFGGGGGFLLRPQFDVYHDALNDYREFFESHADLYAGLLPWSDTLVLALPEQGWMGNNGHLAGIRRLTPSLADAHVRFEFVSERRLATESWAGTACVAAFHVASLADDHLRRLAGYVDAGGTLLVAGPLAARDGWQRPRARLPQPLQGVTDLADGGSSAAGKGRVVRLEDESAFAAFLARSGIGVDRGDGKSTAGLRLAAYRDPGGTRLVLHLVNYHVPLGVDAPPIETVGDLTLSVPLPPGLVPAGFRVLSPDQPSPVEAEISLQGGAARLRLPRLRLYAVAELLLKPAAGG